MGAHPQDGSITLRINSAILLLALLFPDSIVITFVVPIVLNFIFFWAFSYWECQRIGAGSVRTE